jgi:hypothetical protein
MDPLKTAEGTGGAPTCLPVTSSLSCVAQQYKNVITPPPSLRNGVLRHSSTHVTPLGAPLRCTPREVTWVSGGT